MSPYDILVLAAFASLVVELTLFPVPAESSCFQLLFRADEDASRSDSLAIARRRSGLCKLLGYLLPTLLGVLLFLVPLVAVFAPQILSSLMPVPALQTATLRVAGAVLILAGRTLTFGSALALRQQRAGAGGARRDGMFAISRNPGLVGQFAFYLGLCLLFPCWVLLLGFVPYFLNMHRRVLMEESQLRRDATLEVHRYLENVPRYLLF